MLKLKRPRLLREVILCYNDMADKLEGYTRELDKKVGSIAEKAGDLDSSVKTLTRRMGELLERLDKIETDMANLDERVCDLEDR